MFDHVVFGVSDYAASKTFFLKALEPLDVAVIQEGPLGVELSRPEGKVRCACAKRTRSRHIFTWRSRPRIAGKSRLSIARLWRRVAKTMVRLVCARRSCPWKWCRKSLSSSSIVPLGLLPTFRPAPAPPAT